MIDHTQHLSVSRQCQVLNQPRSTAYYQPVPVSAEELALMRWIDDCIWKFRVRSVERSALS